MAAPLRNCGILLWKAKKKAPMPRVRSTLSRQPRWGQGRSQHGTCEGPLKMTSQTCPRSQRPPRALWWPPRAPRRPQVAARGVHQHLLRLLGPHHRLPSPLLPQCNLRSSTVQQVSACSKNRPCRGLPHQSQPHLPQTPQLQLLQVRGPRGPAYETRKSSPTPPFTGTAAPTATATANVIPGEPFRQHPSESCALPSLD
jgi:hypothetical protein